MADNSMAKKVYEWSPALTRSLGRPKNRWEDDVKGDRDKNNKLEGLHQRLDQMEDSRWEGKNFPEVVAPQEQEEELTRDMRYRMYLFNYHYFI